MSSWRDPEQQRKILAVLLVGMFVVVAWRFGVPALYEWAGGDEERGRAASRTRSLTGQEVVDIRLEELIPENASYVPDRNIFRFAEKKAPPPPPPPPPRPRDFTPPPPPPPPPPVVPRPPAIPYRLLGIFGPEERRLAVLVDGEEIQNALENDVLQETFIVDEIGFESVQFRFVDFPEATERIEISGSR